MQEETSLPNPFPATPNLDGAELGERVRLVRRARGMSQRALASVGVSVAYISRIEQGHRVPSLEVIRLLATALDVSPQWLETGDDGRWSGLTRAELAAVHAALLRSGGPASLRLAAELEEVLERRAEIELAADGE
jgi:transcriptional regulator with XRE-family HTH domain